MISFLAKNTQYPDITNYKNIFVSYLAIYISIFCKCIRKTSLYNTTDLQKNKYI